MFRSAITFPGLGLTFDPARIAFNLFGKDVYWYGILIGVGFLLALLYTDSRAKRFGISEDQLINTLLCAVPAAVVSARVYYCVFNWAEFRDNPITCLYIWNGGIAIYGAVIGGAVAAFAYCRFRRVRFSAMMDLLCLGLLIGQMIGRWGNFVNREAYGATTESFFRMGLTAPDGTVQYVHPTFLYESLWNAVGFVLLHVLSKRRSYDGQIFTLYIAWYGLGRGMIEGLRTDSLYLFHTGLRVSQCLGYLSCVIALCVLIYHAALKKKTEPPLFVEEIAAQTPGDTEQSAQI